jgi:hypothetical protein
VPPAQLEHTCAAAAWPVGQGVQAVEPALLKVPLGQFTQTEPVLRVLAEQVTQLLAALPSGTLPEGHATQAVAPVPPLNVPGGHGKHSGAPDEDV